MSETTTEYVSLDEVAIPGEDQNVAMASEDFQEWDRRPLEPGKYLSKFRKIVANKDKPLVDPATGKISVKVDFSDNGLEGLDGTEIKYPPFAWLDSEAREVRFNGIGKVSSIQRYLTACKIPLPNNAKVSEIVEALKRSQTIPVFAEVEWQDDYRERPEGAKGLYTKAFKVGDKYQPQVKLQDGRVVKAVAKINRFRSVE